MSDRALSKVAFWGMLLIHCIAGLVLFAMLIGFVREFEELFERLRERAELPAITVYMLVLYKYWYCIFVLGFALDAAVLFALGRLPPRLRWLAAVWFGSMLAAIILLSVTAILGVLVPVLKMGNTI